MLKRREHLTMHLVKVLTHMPSSINDFEVRVDILSIAVHDEGADAGIVQALIVSS